MKKLYLLFALILIVPALHAQKYGYINKEELYKSMPEYDSASVKIENVRKEYETQLAAMQGELSSKTSSLNNESANISAFLRQTREDEIKNLNIRIQMFSVRANAQLEENRNLLLRPLEEKANKAIGDVAKEEGLIFVLDASQLYYTDEKKCTNILPLVKVKLGVK